MDGCCLKEGRRKDVGCASEDGVIQGIYSRDSPDQKGVGLINKVMQQRSGR